MRQDRSLATVSLTARQFIEFHGISPRSVFVESCENAPIADNDPASPGLQGPGGTQLFELDPEICTQDQRKLVRVTAGRVFDGAVDMRAGSPRFGHWAGTELSGENHRQLWIPPGFAHGFCVLSEVAEVEYKCSDVYVPSDEITIAWNDPAIGVQWPTARPLLSKRDEAGEPLAALGDRLPVYRG